MFLGICINIFAALALNANAQSLDDVNALAVVLKARSANETTLRALYKVTAMDAGLEFFRADKVRALHLVGRFPELSSADIRATMMNMYDEKRFLKEYSEEIDEQLNGLSLKDTAPGKVIKFAVGAVASHYSKPLPPSARFGLSTYVDLSTESLLKSVVLREPRIMNATDDQALIQFSNRSVKLMSNPTSPLAPHVRNTFKSELNISDFKKLKESPEYQVHQLKNDASEKLGTLNELVQNNRSEVEAIKRKYGAKIGKMVALAEDNKKLLDGIKEWQTRADVAEETRQQRILEQRRKLQENEEAMKAMAFGFSFMEFVAAKNGASPTDIQEIRKFQEIAHAFVGIATFMGNNKISEDMEKSMTNWFYFGWVLFKNLFGSSGNQPNPHVAIMGALKSLAQQLDSFREEMHARLNFIDGSLAYNFTYQTSVLEAILGHQQGNSKDLYRMYEEMRKSKDHLQSILEVQFNRQNDVLLGECLAVPNDAPENMQVLRKCLVYSKLSATSWASDSVSVANSFSEFFRPAQARSLNPISFMSSFARIIPLYSGTQSAQMPNPLTWKYGADLTITLLAKHPSLLRETTPESISEVLLAGKPIQNFYRSYLVSERNEVRTFNTQNVLKLTADYVDKAKEYVEEFKKAKATVEMPWTGNPDEILLDETEEIRARIQTKGAIQGNSLALHSSSSSYAEAGRKLIPSSKSSRYEISKSVLRACPGMKAKLHTATDWDRSIGSPASIAPAVAKLNGAGFALDTSILSLVPRRAIWYERLAPTVNKIGFCVKDFEGYSGHYRDVSPGILAFQYWIKLKLSVYISVGGKGFEIQEIEGGIRTEVPIHYKQHSRFFVYDVLDKSWSGFKLNQTMLGPIKGNLDKYFWALPPSAEHQRNLEFVGNDVKRIRAEKVAKFEESIKQGNLGKAAEELELSYQVLKGLIMLNRGTVPELNDLLLSIGKPLVLNSPDGFERLLLEGVEPEIVVKNAAIQLFDIRRKCAAMANKPLPAVSTPVDGSLTELELLSRLARKANVEISR